jgi:putative membrane protein
LGVVAAGVGLAVLESTGAAWSVVRVPAALVCTAGAALAVAAVVRWARVERAVRRGEPIPAPSALFLLAVMVGVVGAGLAVLVLTTRL